MAIPAGVDAELALVSPQHDDGRHLVDFVTRSTYRTEHSGPTQLHAEHRVWRVAPWVQAVISLLALAFLWIAAETPIKWMIALAKQALTKLIS
jgi:hypothetical protein